MYRKSPMTRHHPGVGSLKLKVTYLWSKPSKSAPKTSTAPQLLTRNPRGAQSTIEMHQNTQVDMQPVREIALRDFEK